MKKNTVTEYFSLWVTILTDPDAKMTPVGQAAFSRKAIAATLAVLLMHLPLHPFMIPSLYQCSALRVTQRKDGRTYSRGFQVKCLYIHFTASDVTVSGIHSKIIVCRKLRIRSIEADTVYLDDPEEVSIRHSDLKLYLNNDTLMGNVNLFEQDTSDLEIKALVKRINRIPDPALEQSCR